MNRRLRYIIARTKRSYYPYIIFGFIIFSLIAMVLQKEYKGYYNKKYKYFIEFPEGWEKDYERLDAVSFRSPEIIPIAQLPEATVVVAANDRTKGVDLASHFQWIMRDLIKEDYYILNRGITYIGLEEARWVEFQDKNGINNHIWYIFFNNTDNVLIIQNRISVYHVDKYRDVLAKMLDTVQLKK